MSSISEKQFAISPASRTLVWLVILLFLVGVSLGQSKARDQNEIPNWLMEHMTFVTHGSGYFVSSNARYMSKDEPFDQYAMQWKWGANKKSIEGQMSSLKDGKELKSPMEVRVVWDAGAKKARVYQTTSDGTFGVGEIRNFKSEDKTEREVDVEFYTPGGGGFRLLHKVIERQNEYVGTAFFLINGSWNKHRSYTWRRVPVRK